MAQGTLAIAQVAPLHEAVPPKLYGGTERVVSHLTESLVAMGHDVTLFATGDSETSARLVPVVPSALRLTGAVDPIAAHVLLLEQVASRAMDFDVIHFHCDYLHFPVSRRLAASTLTTLHGRLDIPELVPLYKEFTDAPLVSVSDAQRAPLPWACWMATIYHGLPASTGTVRERPGKYLAVLGRISPEKGVDRAIEIARKVGMELRIAAKVDDADRVYFETVIRPMLDQPGIEFLGEIGEEDKDAFLGEAYALLFPVDWPEPFGLVMIEAMARGTPVIGYRRGSVPEVIDPGVTGYLVESVDEAARALEGVTALSRAGVRERFDARFTSDRMARDYVDVYRRLCEPFPDWSVPCERASSA